MTVAEAREYLSRIRIVPTGEDDPELAEEVQKILDSITDEEIQAEIDKQEEIKEQ